MTCRIAIVSPKGGVGKTTVALNLALAFADRGQRTLVVDLDPQGGVGHALDRGDTSLRGLADVLMERATPGDALLVTKHPRLAFLPRGRLSPVDAGEFEQAVRAPDALGGVLRIAEAGFDRVLLDTPSGMGSPTRGALAVADFALLPLQAEPLALRSLTQALQVVEHVQVTENPNLHFLGIVATMVDRSRDPSLSTMMDLWGTFAGVLETTVARADVYNEASAAGLPIAYLGGPTSPEIRRFESLAAELDSLIAGAKGTELTHEHAPQRQLL